MKTIYSNYKIDDDGNIYSKRGMLKPKLDKKRYRVNINQKWVSYARVVACFLIANPHNYDRILFIDSDPLNCKPNNIKWVSEMQYRAFTYSCQMKEKVSTPDVAIKKAKCPILKKYYSTGDIGIINDYFISVSRDINVTYWREIQGAIYIKIIEKLRRCTLLYDLKVFIVSRLEFYHYQFLNAIA